MPNENDDHGYKITFFGYNVGVPRSLRTRHISIYVLAYLIFSLVTSYNLFSLI